MFYNYYFAGYEDGLWLALIAVLVLSLIAQSRVNSIFKKYARVEAQIGVPASRAAESFLRDAGSDTGITQVKGRLTDHYNPKTNVVGLSESVYNETSVAALAVASHEIGHVLQYQEGYFPIRLRNAVLPVANFGSQAAPFIVIIGLMMGSFDLAIIGVVLFGAMLLFQVVTLPVEFNASHRAIELLTNGGYLTYDEIPQAKKVLRAAAFTYVVAALSSLVTLLRLLNIANRSRRR